MGLTQKALDAAEGNGYEALFVAVRIRRWRMIADGQLNPFDGERLPPKALLDQLSAQGGDA